ncbi:MAG TPA: hypothetical protein VKU41_14535 [Polyangiaceae bacterium]|nr:hypothetical protein [Polyangiaceae bacterium]
MTKKQRLEPHEAWDVIEKMALEDDIERIAKMSDAEVDEELARGGFDPAKVRERAEALAAGARKRASRRRPWWPAAAAVTALAAGMAVVVGVAREDGRVTSGPPPAVQADRLRRDALAECRERRFTACERMLDEAKELDPGGERLPEVHDARTLLERQKNPPKP